MSRHYTMGYREPQPAYVQSIIFQVNPAQITGFDAITAEGKTPGSIEIHINVLLREPRLLRGHEGRLREEPQPGAI
jgi:hypothetical protein